MLRSQVHKVRLALISGNPEAVKGAEVWISELLKDQLLQQIRNFTNSDLQAIREGRLVKKYVTALWFHFAFELCRETREPIKETVFELVGKAFRFDIQSNYDINEKRRVHYIEVEARPDEDFINFEKEVEVEEVKIDAVADKPKTMAAHG